MIADELVASRPRSVRVGSPVVMAAERPVRAGTRMAVGAWGLATDALWLMVIVAALPIVILAVGTPIALAIRLLLWVGGLL